MQQTLEDDVPGVYTVIDGQLPGAWRYRMDHVWQNMETNELVVIRPTYSGIDDAPRELYRVNVHVGGGVDTILDNIPKERADRVVALYIRRGEIPEDSWMYDEEGGA